jgi:iron(III) transport system permease protein
MTPRRPPLQFVLLAAALGLTALAGPRVQGLLANSLTLAAAALALATPFALALAVLIAKTQLRAARTGLLVMGSLLLLPLPLYAAAWQVVLPLAGQRLGNLEGAVFIHALAGIPWLTLLFAAALASVDPELEEQAWLEVAPLRVLSRVTLRSAAQGLGAAVLWVGALQMSEMAVTDLCRVRTFAEEIYTQAALGMFFGGDVDPLTIGIVPEAPLELRGLLCGLGAIWLVAWAALVTLARLVVRSLGDQAARVWRWRPSHQQKCSAELLAGVIVLAVALAPLIALASRAGIVVTKTGAGFERSWSPSALASQVLNAPWEQRRELWQSTKLGVATATASIAIGLALAWRLRREGPHSLLMGILALMLVIPGPVVGVALIRLLNRPVDSSFAWLAWWYDHTLLGAWLAQLVRVVPIATFVLWPALASVPQSLLDAAASEGAGRFTQLTRVVIPLRWPAIAAAWLVGLAISFGELAASILVLPPGPPTLVVRIFSLLHYGVEDRVAAICLVLIASASAVMLAIHWLLAKSSPK